MKKRIGWWLIGVFLVASLCWIGYVSEAASAPAPAEKGMYEVVWPLSRKTVPDIPAAKRLDTLAGKTICEVTDGLFRYEETFPWIEEELTKRYPGIKFVKYDVFESFDYVEIDRKYKVLPQRAKENRCDAFIGGNGC